MPHSRILTLLREAHEALKSTPASSSSSSVDQGRIIKDETDTHFLALIREPFSAASQENQDLISGSSSFLWDSDEHGRYDTVFRFALLIPVHREQDFSSTCTCDRRNALHHAARLDLSRVCEYLCQEMPISLLSAVDAYGMTPSQMAAANDKFLGVFCPFSFIASHVPYAASLLPDRFARGVVRLLIPLRVSCSSLSLSLSLFLFPAHILLSVYC